jgi:flavin reductase (DIM6/NTAB) family NADH-FMN oxidoreductase RutF
MCALQQCVDAGDHLILVGRVDGIERHPGRALVWCESDYHCLPAPRSV